MSSFYDNLSATASRLLLKYGQSVVFTRPNAGSTFNPVTGVYSGGTPTTITGYGAAFAYNKSEIDGTVIQSGDIRLLLEAVTSAPAIGDTVPVNGATYRVMSVAPLSPAGTVVKYDVQLRV